MSDLLLYQTLDDGEINYLGRGEFERARGYETAVYLSLFGGNFEDDGRAENKFQWWGNMLETDPEKHYRSETQYLLRSIPAIPNNIVRISDAVQRDLRYLPPEVKVQVTIPVRDRVKIVVDLDNETFTYEQPWLPRA